MKMPSRRTRKKKGDRGEEAAVSAKGKRACRQKEARAKRAKEREADHAHIISMVQVVAKTIELIETNKKTNDNKMAEQRLCIMVLHSPLKSVSQGKNTH